MSQPEFLFDMEHVYPKEQCVTGNPLIYRDGTLTVTSSFLKTDDPEDYFYLSVLCEHPNMCIFMSFDKNCKFLGGYAEHFQKKMYMGTMQNWAVAGKRKERKLAKMIMRRLAKLTTSIPIRLCTTCEGRGIVKEPASSNVEDLLDDKLICPECHLSGAVALEAPKIQKIL